MIIARTSGRSTSSIASGIARSIAWLIALRFSGRLSAIYASSPSIRILITFSAIARHLDVYSTACCRGPPDAKSASNSSHRRCKGRGNKTSLERCTGRLSGSIAELISTSFAMRDRIAERSAVVTGFEIARREVRLGVRMAIRIEVPEDNASLTEFVGFHDRVYAYRSARWWRVGRAGRSDRRRAVLPPLERTSGPHCDVRGDAKGTRRGQVGHGRSVPMARVARHNRRPRGRSLPARFSVRDR